MAARQRAEDARTKATESARVTGAIETQAPLADFTPSDELKRLYREIAKRIHPDLATDPDERARRTRMMADVNRAYADGDEARLRSLLNEWETSPDVVTGDGVGAELVRTIRKIHQVQTRLARLESEIAALIGSELAVLKARAESERMNGRDVLTQMAAQLSERIAQLRRQRDRLRPDEAFS